MEKCLSNVIYGDDPIDPWTGRRYQRDLRQTGRDWPGKAHTMIGLHRLHNTRTLAERAITEGIPGNFIETGVWRGGASIMMRAVCAAYGERERHVYCADSFKGLPEPNADDFPLDANDAHSSFEQLAIPVDEVRRNFSAYDLLDDTVHFLEGWFKDTLPSVDADFAVVRLDGDMYESTIQAIEVLYPRLAPGGYLIVDDYGAVPACRQAIHDYRDANGIDSEIHPVDWTGVWWKKAA